MQLRTLNLTSVGPGVSFFPCSPFQALFSHEPRRYMSIQRADSIWLSKKKASAPDCSLCFDAMPPSVSALAQSSGNTKCME